MDQQINDWLKRIDAVSARVEKLCAGLNAATLNLAPAPRKWCIGQQIDHLIKVTQSFQPTISALQQGSYSLAWPGRIGFLVRFFGNMVLKSLEPNNKQKIRTFPVWEPAQSNFSPSIVHDFLEEQKTLKNTISSSANLLAKNTVISSPAAWFVVYRLSTAYEIIVKHQERHLEKIVELVSKLE